MENKYKLILASASPRRKDLLGYLGIPFEIIVSHTEEKVDSRLQPHEIAIDIAEKKAINVAHKIEPKSNYFIMAADTIVVFNGSILGKPKNLSEAKSTLLSMSGNTHEVITAVVFKWGNQKNAFHVKSTVEFDLIDDYRLERYLKTKDSLDKAGSYGIQGAGLSFIKSVHGSYSNVVGLPIDELYRQMIKVLSKNLSDIFIL